MFERLLKLAALAARPSEAEEVTIVPRRIPGGVRLDYSNGDWAELTVEECLAIAQEMGMTE